MHLFNFVFGLILAVAVKAEPFNPTHDFLNRAKTQIQEHALQTEVQKLLDIAAELNTKLDELKTCSCPRYHKSVFHVSNGRYTYNFADAQSACEARGAKLASPNQLAAAQKAGFDACVAGWLSDGTLRYPITMPRPGCGMQPAGVRNWGTRPKNSKVADAYCFKKDLL